MYIHFYARKILEPVFILYHNNSFYTFSFFKMNLKMDFNTRLAPTPMCLQQNLSFLLPKYNFGSINIIY